jgi:hypothetical protein
MKVPKDCFKTFCSKTLFVNSVGLAATVALYTPAIAADAPKPAGTEQPTAVEMLKSRDRSTTGAPCNGSVARGHCSSPEQISQTPALERVEDYARGKVQSSQPALNQIDRYINEGSKDEAISIWRSRMMGGDPLKNQLDRYSYEGMENEALDVQSNRSVPIFQLNDTPTLDWTFEASNPEENPATTDIAQVTSVSQLRDVRPTDWAFTALQTLVERYGVIAGYPDRTYRGNQALTRYEFAAGLNAALDRVNELVAAGAANLVSKEDLEALDKLQTEFKTELDALKGRTDLLENRVAKLEKDRFSFTSKLFGLAFFNYTGLFGAEGTLREIGFRQFPFSSNIASSPIVRRIDKNPNTTSSSLVWLTLGSSFTGRDLLLTQLAAGRGISPSNVITSTTSTINSTGIPFTDAGALLGPGAPLVLRELAYTFPVFGNGNLTIGPRINWFRFFDANPYTFFSTGTTSLNSIANTLTTDVRRGAGAILYLPLSPKFDFRVGYLAESNEYFLLDFDQFNSASSVREGLFGGSNILTAEVTFKPTPTFNFRMLFARQNSQARTQFLDNQVPLFSPVKLVSGAPLNALADDGLGGDLENGQSNIFQLNMDYLIGRRLGLFARYGIANTRLNAEIDSRSGNVTTQTFQVGFALLDLFKRGAQATFSFVMPFHYSDGRRFLVAGAGDGATQYELEGTYFFPVTQNIAIVPSFQVIFNLNNFSTNPTIGIFNVRTQFSF